MTEYSTPPLGIIHDNSIYDTPYSMANKMIDKAYEAAISHNKDINVEVDVDGTANTITLNFYIHESGDK